MKAFYYALSAFIFISIVACSKEELNNPLNEVSNIPEAVNDTITHNVIVNDNSGIPLVSEYRASARQDTSYTGELTNGNDTSIIFLDVPGTWEMDKLTIRITNNSTSKEELNVKIWLVDKTTGYTSYQFGRDDISSGASVDFTLSGHEVRQAYTIGKTKFKIELENDGWRWQKNVPVKYTAYCLIR